LSLDQKIYELRRAKLKQIEALGHAAYPYKYDTTHSVAGVLGQYSDKTAEQLESPRVEVRIAGRIMGLRLMGKAGFAHVQQAGKRLQIYVKKDAVGEKGFELFQLLDIGDHIGARGKALYQFGHRLAVMGLAGSQNDADRQAAPVNQCIDLGAQSSTRTANGVIRAPFFPPAAC